MASNENSELPIAESDSEIAAVASTLENTDLNSGSDVDWAGKVEYSAVYGNHVIASRLIEEGEVILEEFPLVESPDYGPIPPGLNTDDIYIYLCLNCSLKITEDERCAKCHWPLCQNGICDKAAVHLDAECKVFTEHTILPRCNPLDYSAVGLLRCLQLRDTHSESWAKILKFEAHIEARKKVQWANDFTISLMDYARTKLPLESYSEEEIEQAIGVLTINTFWSIRDLPSRSASLLFDKVTLLAHDCDPNTFSKIIEKPVLDENGISQNRILIRITATRRIQPGQLVAINYINCNLKLEERQERLKEWFYFECICQRCVREGAERTKSANFPDTTEDDEVER